MRITKKMMSGNSLANINANKEYLDHLNNKMATQKKITRPSDDPIIAIRALRLRSNLSELTQYSSANVTDAQSWVSVTESAINSTKEMLSSLKAYADQGANGTNTSSDREKIYENVRALQKQIYSNGNVTDAGRYVFSGYRTGESLTFPGDTEMTYTGISDGFNASDLTRNTYVSSPFSFENITENDLDETVGKLDSTGKLSLPGTMNAATKKGIDTYEDFTITFQYGSEAADTKIYVINGNSIKDNATGTKVGEVDCNGLINITPPEYTLTKNAEGHYEKFTVTFQSESGTPVTRKYSVTDSGDITVPGTGETDVIENKVNRIRLSYDNIDTRVKTTALPGRYSGDEADTISGWAEGSVHWGDFVTDGKLNTAGQNYTPTVTIDGISIGVRFDPKCDQTLNWSPDNPDIVEMVGLFKDEDQYVGDQKRAGNIYTLRYDDTTRLTYRTELEKGASIPPNSVKTDPVEGLQSFKIDYNGESYTIQKLNGVNNDGGWWAVDSSGACIMKIEVTQNTDRSFNIKVPTKPANPSGAFTVDEYDVFNVSANGKTITSYYHETNLKVKITTSDAKVATDSTGKDVTAYEFLSLNPDEKNSDSIAANAIYLLSDTGELVFGSNVAATLGSLKDIPGVDTISVKYDKTSFKEGELRPEHYFDTTYYDDNHNITNPLIYDDHSQDIVYTVGANQNIKINTNAEDVFDPQIKRQIDDILTAISEYDAIEEKVNKLKGMQENPDAYTPAQQENIQKLLDAEEKELDIAKNKLQRTYEESITNFGKYFEQANQAQTACGTIDSRLELVANRLAEEKSTVTTLSSNNENVDMTEIATEVSEASLIYNAALMSTSQITQQTMMDYI